MKGIMTNDRAGPDKLDKYLGNNFLPKNAKNYFQGTKIAMKKFLMIFQTVLILVILVFFPTTLLRDQHLSSLLLF